jgi:hypothetical protein
MVKFLIYLVFFASLSYSQRVAERMVIFNPLFNEQIHAEAGKTNWINSVSGWGEFGGYFLIDDMSHAWYQKLGAFAEFFRISDKQSLALLSNIEFIADPHNDINFNPRAIFWEEAFLYSLRTGKGFWQLGYYHRCKHDIDNLDFGYERTLIYGSIHSRYSYPFFFGKNTDALATLRGDLYTILQDYMRSDLFGVLTPLVDKLSFSTALNFNVRHKLSDSFGLYFTSFSQFNFYSSRDGFFRKLASINDITFSGGAESGLTIRGSGRVNIGLRYEYFADTGFHVLPVHAHLLSLGLSFLPFEFF